MKTDNLDSAFVPINIETCDSCQEMERLRVRINELEYELSGKTRELEETRNSFLEKERALFAARAGIKNAEYENMLLKVNVKNKDQMISALKQEVSGHNQKHAELVALVAKLESQVKAGLQGLEVECTNSKNMAAASNKKLGQTIKSLESSQVECTSIKSKLEAALAEAAKIPCLEQTIAEMGTHIKELEESMNTEAEDSQRDPLSDNEFLPHHRRF